MSGSGTLPNAVWGLRDEDNIIRGEAMVLPNLEGQAQHYTVWTGKFVRCLHLKKCKPTTFIMVDLQPPLTSMVGLHQWVYTGQTCWSIRYQSIWHVHF